MAENSSLERRVTFYPRPNVYKMFMGYCEVECLKQSEAASEIVKKHFNSLPQSEQTKLIQAYEEKQKHPHK